MNQSELEASTCNRRQARENACEREQVTTDWFEFYAWLVEKVARKVLTNLDTQLKTALKDKQGD